MVMNVVSLMESNNHPTQQIVEDHLDGHICRCTGYRPILQAFRSFASDSGRDDSYQSTFTCQARATEPAERADRHPQYHHNLYARGTDVPDRPPQSYRSQAASSLRVRADRKVTFPQELLERVHASPRLEFKRRNSCWIRSGD